MQTNLFTKQRQTNRLRKQHTVMGGRSWEGEGTDWEFGMAMYTLLCLKQITRKELLYSTGSAAQHSVISQMGKEGKKNRYMYK